ncbi:MAG: hypothetical protein K2N56_02580 [Oscillospiraceae bacterium]|nr:hypothetical protein [Oscillospiraceae bacterium]
MSDFTKKQLAGSLCCPVLCFLWGLIRSLYDLSWGAEFSGKGIFRMSYLAAVLVGGIISAVLTLGFKIHTEYYLDKRLIVIAVVIVFHGIVSRFMFSNTVILLVMYMAVSAAALVVEFVKIHDVNTDRGERTVLILSDPIIYWTAYWLVLYIA